MTFALPGLCWLNFTMTQGYDSRPLWSPDPRNAQMRHLTLVLADVYLPAEASTMRPDSVLALPALERAARYARVRSIEHGWRAWLARELGFVGAPIWRATPVEFEARLDHVRLTERGLLTLEAAERTELMHTFNAVFGPQFELADTASGDLVLRGLGEASEDVASTDPARLLGEDVARGLPQGSAARRVRALAAEMEMWLHEHAINRARQRVGMPLLSALWLWRDVPIEGHEAVVTESVALDALLAAIARDGRRRAALLWPMTHAAMERIDRAWVARGLECLARRELDRLEVVANDRVLTLRRADLWQFWRPRRSWVEQLRAGAGAQNRR